MKLISLFVFLTIYSLTICQESNPKTVIKTYNTFENREDKDFFNQASTEAFLNCKEYLTTENLEKYESWFNRIVIHQVSLNEYPECVLLSSIGKKNKCNSTLSYDLANFDPFKFNPLKYHFQYYSTKSTYYRVDNMNYIIEIKPISQK